MRDMCRERRRANHNVTQWHSLVKVASVTAVVAAEHKHGVPVNDGGVAMPGRRGQSRERCHRCPLHRFEVKLKEVVHSLAPVKSRKDEEGVPMDNAGVSVPGRWADSAGADGRPYSCGDVKLVKIAHAI